MNFVIDFNYLNRANTNEVSENMFYSMGVQIFLSECGIFTSKNPMRYRSNKKYLKSLENS